MATAEVKMSEVKPSEIKWGEKAYYRADDLRVYDPSYFNGCNTVRQIITKKKIEPPAYLYATYSKKKGWTPSTSQSTPSSTATLLLLSGWVDANMPKMNPVSSAEIDTYREHLEHPEPPPLLQLEESEKFKNNAGKIFNIETRGLRTASGVYFLGRDVADAFEMPNLVRNMKGRDSSYEKGEHYKIFMSLERLPGKTPKRLTYITYEGILKILYSSHSIVAKTFRRWATDILFTHQMGNEEQKETLASNVLGIPVKNLRAVLKTSTKSVPCIYMFSLGTAQTLRRVLELPDTIPDDATIVKYGLTKDLVRRASEHVRNYEQIKGVSVGLLNFTYIDPKFLSQAESHIREFFKTIETPIQYKSFAELVAINSRHTSYIKTQFDLISTEFSGAVTDLVTQIERLKNEHLMKVKDLTHTIELKDAELRAQLHIIELKDSIIAYKDKDIENLNLKLELASLKLTASKSYQN